MIVVSDTSPICYLLLIGEIELLPQLYGQVLIPRIVTGVLGVLDRAAKQNLVDFPQTIAALKKTTFRASTKLIESLLSQY